MHRVELHLTPNAYRILYAIGGVRVVSVDPQREGERLLRVKLLLSDSMLAFARELEGVEGVIQLGDTASSAREATPTGGG